MSKRALLVSVLLLSLVFGTMKVEAACDASKATVEYRTNEGSGVGPEMEGENDDPLVDYEEVKFNGLHFEIVISNLENGVYGVITNNHDSESYTFRSTDAVNGVISYKYPNTYSSVVHTVKFYGDGDACKDVLLKSTDVTLPKMNSYYETPTCSDKKYSDFEYCKPFIDEEITLEEFETELKKYQDENGIKVENVDNVEYDDQGPIKIIGFWEANRLIILISLGVGIVIIGIISGVIIMKRRKK